ncbi:hypothetical protein SAMN02927930_01458 [Pseudidiomarina indica]|uniref:Replication initiation factor n=1 Tax=Pseudidiomarina indica TaxID=1159017 RepID=A0A1G6CYJ3_9GAMM|nr:hypothetical protein [Pseudidiomarina indica]SDB37890.1 hypothetical protein SAMN02927930_01458 [Pseudidiomarina indica]
MPISEPVQKTADADNRFASQKRTDFGVNANLADVQGAPPCNTAPSKYSETEVLRAGVDSLYLSFHGELRVSLLHKLDQLKEIAKGARCGEERQPTLQLAGVSFKVHAKGRHVYPFVISNKHFSVCIAGNSGFKAPPAYIEISSELLTKYGYENCLDMARKLAKQLFKECDGGSISRFDLCCDFITELDWLSVDPLAWVCRSKKRSEYRESNILTGYVFGAGGDIVGRLYDKTHEIKLSEKAFFKEVWREFGWDGEQSVWRLEFQVRQQVVKSIGCVIPEMFVELMNSVWRYLTEDWLSLRDVLSKDKNRSRWPLNSNWQTLKQASFNLVGIEDINRARFDMCPTDYAIFTGALGYLTSFMAKNEFSSLDEALKHFEHSAQQHFERDEKRTGTLDQYVGKKLAEKLTKFVMPNQDLEAGE